MSTIVLCPVLTTEDLCQKAHQQTRLNLKAAAEKTVHLLTFKKTACGKNLTTFTTASSTSLAQTLIFTSTTFHCILKLQKNLKGILTLSMSSDCFSFLEIYFTEMSLTLSMILPLAFIAYVNYFLLFLQYLILF